MRLLTIILLFALASCGRKMQPQITTLTKDSLVYKEVVKLKDTTIVIPGKEITVFKAIPCPEADFDTSIRKENLTATVKLSKGKLTINCKADSLMQRIAWLEKERNSLSFKTVIKTIPVPYDVIKYKVPKWCWWLLLVVGLYFGCKYFLPRMLNRL